ncbi:MAG: hypothetical protein WC707_02255 [Candidatus Babeliaceae bacterium]|jgi:hypothetical protein
MKKLLILYLLLCVQRAVAVFAYIHNNTSDSIDAVCTIVRDDATTTVHMNIPPKKFEIIPSSGSTVLTHVKVVGSGSILGKVLDIDTIPEHPFGFKIHHHQDADIFAYTMHDETPGSKPGLKFSIIDF